MEISDRKSSPVAVRSPEKSLKSTSASRPRLGCNSSKVGYEKQKDVVPVEDPALALARKVAELDLDMDDYVCAYD